MLGNRQGDIVDSWSAFVPGRGEIVEEFEAKVIQRIEAKGVQGLTSARKVVRLSKVAPATGQAQEHVIFSRWLEPFLVTRLALRIARRGNEDLEVSWHLLWWKRNVLGELGNLLLATGCFLGAGLFLWISQRDEDLSFVLLVISVGLLLLGLSYVGRWWNTRNAPVSLEDVSAFVDVELKMLGATADHAIMSTLEEFGVEPHEVRIMRHSYMFAPPPTDPDQRRRK